MASSVSQTETHGASTSADWRTVLARAVRDPAELCRLAGLPPSEEAAMRAAAEAFPILAPRPFLARVQPGNARDPLLLQVMPRPAEQKPTPGFEADPLGESTSLRAPGLLWKYPSRSLIVTTGQCGVHCRFCFRRHFPYPKEVDKNKSKEGVSGSDPLVSPQLAPCEAFDPAKRFDASIRAVAGEPSLSEVILSGGDPLTLDDEPLARLIHRLDNISHLTRLRIHTRMPILVPQRVTDILLDVLRATRLTTLVVIHVNHPAEIDAAVAEGLGRLVDAGIPVLSQSVLLRDVNDRVDVLASLYQRLADLRVLPYYLHQLDHVAGAAHFEAPESTGIELINTLRARLPGYVVPRYVRETPGGVCKEVLA